MSKDEKAEPLFWVRSLPTTGQDEFNMKAWGFHQDGSLCQRTRLLERLVATSHVVSARILEDME